MLWIRINDGAEYATSGTLSLTFPGLVADRVEVAETDDFSDATSYDPESTVVFSLASLEQGLRPLYGRAFRGDPSQESGPLLIGSVILDTEAPVLVVTEPGHQSTTADPAVHVRGTVSDAGGPIRVWVNQKPVHGVDHGAFWLADYPLAPGENQLVVVAADAAGNESQQILTVTRNPAGDSTPPTVDFNLPANPTRVGDIEFLDILGTTDDPYASVEYTVTGVSGTTGPHAAHVVNGWMYTQIPLQPGENTVSVTARDAAGNEAQLQYAVIRSEGVAFHIDSPEYFHVQHGPTLGVGGIAPNDFTDITANGEPVGLSYPPGGHISFGDTVSITPDLNLIRIRAVDSQDRIWYDQLVAIGYEILSYTNEARWPRFGKQYYADGGYHRWSMDPNDYRLTWDASSLALRQVEAWFSSSTKFTPPDIFVVDDGPLGGWDDTDAPVFSPPSAGRFETGSSVEAYREYPPEELLGGGLWETIDEDTSLRFRKFFPEGGTQLVVLHFEDMDYHRKPGESAEPDPSQITLFDNPGFWYAGDEIGFLVEIENGQEYAINRDAFTWPGFNYLLPHTHQSLAVTRIQGARLTYSEWGNQELQVDLEAYAAWRGNEDEMIPTEEKEDPGLLVTQNHDPETGDDPKEAKLILKALPANSGLTRYVRFSPPGKLEIRMPDETAPAFVPIKDEVEIPGPIDVDYIRDVAMYQPEHWAANTSVTVEYVVKDRANNPIGSDKVRLLRPVIMAIGDSMTMGFMREEGGKRRVPSSSDGPTFWNPEKNWQSYATAESWAALRDPWGVPANRFNPVFQGYRGHLTQQLPGFLWEGDPLVNEHGPEHMGYNGGTIARITGRYTREAVQTDPCYGIIIYFAGLNNVTAATPQTPVQMYNDWTSGVDQILDHREGNGRTLLVYVTLPRLEEWWDGSDYSSRNTRLEALNASIRAHQVQRPFTNHTVAEAEDIPHDVENPNQPDEVKDDGLHWFSPGFGTLSARLNTAIKAGLSHE